MANADAPIGQLAHLPPLESGDRLSRPEFERRYAAASHIKRAELIEGTVYVASPLRHAQHGRPHSRLMTWLGIYQALTPGVDLSDAPTVRLDLDNEPQPDAVLFIESKAGGQVRIDEEGYLVGAPELIAEIAASSAAIDLGSKKLAYRRNGVQEYIVWQSFEKRLDWFVLEAGDYTVLQPDESGILRSRLFPGLWLAVADLLMGRMAEVLQVVQAGLASEEHRQFVEQLQVAAQRNQRFDGGSSKTSSRG
jgi:Uma2 family endonuclease